MDGEIAKTDITSHTKNVSIFKIDTIDAGVSDSNNSISDKMELYTEIIDNKGYIYQYDNEFDVCVIKQGYRYDVLRLNGSSSKNVMDGISFVKLGETSYTFS